MKLSIRQRHIIHYTQHRSVKLLCLAAMLLGISSCHPPAPAESHSPFLGYIVSVSKGPASKPCDFTIDNERWSCTERGSWSHPVLSMKKRVRVFLSRRAEYSISGGRWCPDRFCITQESPLGLLSNPSLIFFLRSGTAMIDVARLNSSTALYRFYEIERARNEVSVYCVIVGMTNERTIDYAESSCKSGLWSGKDL